jgi:hypothetical protein
MSYDIGDGYYVDDNGDIQKSATDTTGYQTSGYDTATGGDTSSNFNLSDIGKLLKGTSDYGMAGQLVGLGGIGALLNKILGSSANGGYAGYQGSIPKYTASRQQYAVPTTGVASTYKPTDTEIRDYALRPGINDAMVARGMNQFGISPERMAGIMQLPTQDVQARYQAAMGPNMVARRPGSGGVTYFSPMQYALAGSAPAAPVTPATTTPATETVQAAGGGMMYMADGGSTPVETVDQWVARQPDISKIADPMAREQTLENWQKQRPGYVDPINYNSYDAYAGAAGIKDEGGESGQDLQNRANFYGVTPENYQNILSGDITKPMGENQSVYGSHLLSPIQRLAAETARGQGIATMTPQVAALAKEHPDVFNAAAQKYQNYFAKTYPGTLEYQSVLSGPAQYSSSGVTMPAINNSASMYILDKATGKIIKNPMYQKKMAEGGISSLGGYSDGGQLLRGPGDGVSDNIPATIGGRQPARLADGEFVVPARIVSELGNGSTDAGARKLYAMMDRIKATRAKAKNIAANTKADKHLPA